jgi:GNAT superfamily N-acetyltransferase
MSKAHFHVAAGTPDWLARQALQAGLFNHNGGLRFLLEEVADGYHKGATVAVLTENDTQRLHGVAVISNENLISIFVRKEVRGKGWGEKLVRLAQITRGNVSKPIFALPSEDTPKAMRFWQRCGVEVRHHDIPPLMGQEEIDWRKANGRVLVSRLHNGVPSYVFEALYIRQLFSDEYTDEHDGIRGKLAYLFEYQVAPFDYVLYHYGEDYDSCALITERPHELDGNSVKIVELQFFVKEDHRKQGLGQELIDKAKSLYPGRTLFGYHTDTAHRLLKRNGIEDLRRVP